jgi:hypothetical protein
MAILNATIDIKNFIDSTLILNYTFTNVDISTERIKRKNQGYIKLLLYRKAQPLARFFFPNPE